MTSVPLIPLYFFIIDLSIALRKLEAKRRNVERKPERSGVLKEFTDSQVYASQTHRNTLTNRNTRKNNESNSHYLDTYEGLHLQ